MQNTINSFMNDPSLNSGLMLIDSPTGYGKTYKVLQNIYQYIRNSKNKKKIFFVTTLIKNLPIEELKKIYKENGEEHLFDQEVLLIKSNYDFVYERLLKLAIPDEYKTEAYYHLRNKLLKIKELEENNNSICIDYANDLRKQVREKEEQDFRREIIKLIEQKLPKDKQHRREWIRNKKQFQWIGKLYPTVFTDDYKIYMLTVNKLLVRNTTLIERAYEFIKSDLIKNAIIFIDEFDATKATIQQHIINNAINSQDDYIQLFEQIYRVSQTHHIPKSMEKAYQEYICDKESGMTLEDLKREANNIYKQYYLKYSYKTSSESIDRKQSFLFNDNNFHTMLRNNCNYIRISANSEEKQVQIFFEDKETYYKNRSENDIILYGLLRAINNFLNQFKIMVFNWADHYAKDINKSREDKENEFTKENAMYSIYKEYALSDKQIQLMIGNMIELIRKKKEEYIPIKPFYEIGFKYFEFIDSDQHLGKTVFNHIQLVDTPEKVILFLAQQAKIIGISATAAIPTVTGNYDINYLSKELGEGFRRISQETRQSIKKELEEHWKKYRDESVKVHLDIIDYNKKDKNLEERLEELFEDRDFKEKYKMKLGLNLSNKFDKVRYIEHRYCNMITLIRNFLKNPDINSFLCLNSILPISNRESFDLDLLQEMVIDCAEDLNVKPCTLKVLNSSNFNVEKDNILIQLEKGEKIMIFSTYKTIGAGQNLQYKVPKNSKVVQIFDSKLIEDKRLVMKDIDAIYLGDITHMVGNAYDKEDFNKEEMLNFFLTIEYLYQNDEISFDILNRLIKQGFKSYSHNVEIDHEALRKLYDAKSIGKSVTRDIIQAIGRICRTFNKSPDIYIYMTQELLKKMNIDDIEHIILNPEMEKIIEYKKNIRSQDNLEENNDLNKAERISLCGKNYIMRMLSKDWSELSIQLWKDLRNCVLKYPTASTNLSISEPYKEIIEKLYIDNKDLKSDYLFTQAHDFSEIMIDYDNDEIIFREKRAQDKPIFHVNEEQSRLQQILKYSGMKDYFIQNGWATTFGHGEFIMSPILFQNIYKGALGEVSGKFILSKELGIELKDITDVDKFEFFDYELSEDIYIDFKHWKSGYFVDRETKIKEISNKIKIIHAKKVLIINIVSDKNFGINSLKNESIIEIPRLIDNEGKIDKNVIHYLKGVLSNAIK